MTIKATLNSGLAGGDRSASLDRYAARLYERPMPLMAVVELTPVDKIVPTDDASKKDPLVRMRIESLEIATPGEQDAALRKVAECLHLARTATGTLDGDGDVRLAEATIEHAAGLMSGHEVARLRVILGWLITGVEDVLRNDKLRLADVKLEAGRLLTAATAARDTGVQLEAGQ